MILCSSFKLAAAFDEVFSMKSWKFNLRRQSDRNGSTLLLVIILSAVAALLTTAVTTAVISANSVSSATIESQQAYFTARSAANATMQEIINYKKSVQTDTNYSKEVNDFVTGKIVGDNLMDAADSKNFAYIGRGCSNNMGYYEVKSFYVSDAKSSVPVGTPSQFLRIEATGYYPYNSLNTSPTSADLAKCSKSTVSLLMLNNQAGSETPTPPSNPLNVTNPFENILCFTDINQPHLINGASIIGNIVYAGPVDIMGGGPDGINAKGRIFSVSDVYVSDQSLGITSLVSKGNVYLYDYAQLNCDVSAQGNLDTTPDFSYYDRAYGTHGTTICGDTSTKYITGNVYVDGNVKLCKTHITGNVTCGGSVTLDSGSYVTGSVTCGGSVTNYGSIYGTIKQNATVEKVPITYIPVTNYRLYNPAVNMPTDTVYGPTVTQSGVLNNSSFKNRNITVDTSASPISLVVNSSLTLNNQSLKVTGSNNLYIYLQGNDASITLNGSSEIGMSDETAGSKIFIIGSSQSVTVNDTSLLRAFVYLPSGSFNGDWSSSKSNNGWHWGWFWHNNYWRWENNSGNDISDERFIGSIVTAKLYITMPHNSALTLVLYQPDLSNTPFYNDFIGGSTGNSGQGTQTVNTVDSWGFFKWVK